MSTRDWIYEHLEREGKLPPGAKDQVARADLFEAGTIDSIGVVELIGTLEEHFSIRFEAEDLESDGFRTVDGIAAIVDKRRG